MNASQPFLNENRLACNENLAAGSLDQILLVTYYENNAHSSQKQK